MCKISAQYVKACMRKVWKTGGRRPRRTDGESDGRRVGRRPGRTSPYHNTSRLHIIIIKISFLWLMYKNQVFLCNKIPRPQKVNEVDEQTDSWAEWVPFPSYYLILSKLIHLIRVANGEVAMELEMNRFVCNHGNLDIPWWSSSLIWWISSVHCVRVQWRIF